MAMAMVMAIADAAIAVAIATMVDATTTPTMSRPPHAITIPTTPTPTIVLDSARMTPVLYQVMVTTSGLTVTKTSTIPTLAQVALVTTKATTTVNPNDVSMSSRIARDVGESSTTNTFLSKSLNVLINRFADASRPTLMKKLNVEPSPRVLSTVISPPINSMRFLQMLRPSPVPPYLRVVE